MDVLNVIKSWPPVTRVLVLSTVVTSLLVHSKMLNGIWVIYYSPYVWRLPPKIPELWRLFSSFSLTGRGLSILFESYFLYTNSIGLERGSPRFSEPGSYLIFVLFSMALILLLSTVWFGGMVFLNPLVLSMTYIFAQDNPNANVTIYILTFPARYLPYALMLMAVVSDGPNAVWSMLPGLLAGHLFNFLTRIWPTFGGGRNYITTPELVKRWYLGMQQPGPETRDYGTAFRPGAAPATGNTGSGNRGPGRRLGSD